MCRKHNSFALSPPPKPPDSGPLIATLPRLVPPDVSALIGGSLSTAPPQPEPLGTTFGVVDGEPHIAQKPVAATLSHSVGIRIRVSNHFYFFNFEIGLLANTYSNKHTH